MRSMIEFSTLPLGLPRGHACLASARDSISVWGRSSIKKSINKEYYIVSPLGPKPAKHHGMTQLHLDVVDGPNPQMLLSYSSCCKVVVVEGETAAVHPRALCDVANHILRSKTVPEEFGLHIVRSEKTGQPKHQNDKPFFDSLDIQASMFNFTRRLRQESSS